MRTSDMLPFAKEENHSLSRGMTSVSKAKLHGPQGAAVGQCVVFPLGGKGKEQKSSAAQQTES
jgi:hypothetical protein